PSDSDLSDHGSFYRYGHKNGIPTFCQGIPVECRYWDLVGVLTGDKHRQRRCRDVYMRLRAHAFDASRLTYGGRFRNRLAYGRCGALFYDDGTVAVLLSSNTSKR